MFAQNKLSAAPDDPRARQSETFRRALIDAYRSLLRTEREKYGSEFDGDRFAKKIQALSAGQNAAPTTPAAYGLDGAIGVALTEARIRLIRALGGHARVAAPVFAAKAQARFDVWAERAGARLPNKDMLDSETSFFRALGELENAVLPIKTAIPFNRALAREYLAYAAFKASAQGDYIDARHFARKGLQTARAETADEVEPEILSRWNLDSQRAVPTFLHWRDRLTAALDRHRSGAKAVVAAKAQARFDCWVEQVSERADSAFIQKCLSEFLGHMRNLEGRPPTPTTSLVVLFEDNRSRIQTAQLAEIRRAARVAKRVNASSISVVSHVRGRKLEDHAINLAMRRANAVARKLRSLGVRADRIRTLYVNDTTAAPRRKPGNPELRAQRAEIVIN